VPLPTGFIEEGQAKMASGALSDLIGDNLPSGFVSEGKTIPEFRQAPKENLFDKVISFFKDPERNIAKAQNIYALSEVTGLPLHEVNKNYEILRRSSKVTGITSDLDNKEYMQMVMLPGVAVGVVTNPIGTAAGLVAFGALNKAIPTDKLINHLEEQGISDELTTTIELVDFIGKAMIVGGIFHKAPKVAERFLKQKITNYKMPETISLSPAQVRDIYQTGTLTTPEQQSLFASLELNSYDLRGALEHGVNINIPAEKIISIVDKPFWAKIKSLFGATLENKITMLPVEKPTKAPAGLIEGKSPKIITPKIIDNPVQKVITALKEAKSVRGTQETLYAKGRAQKFAKMHAVGEKVRGEKGFYAQLGALKGELPRAEFEAIRSKLTQEDIDSLFNMVKDSPKIGEWEKLAAREGLVKLFGEYGGKVPTENEITLLNEVFGKEFTQAVLDKKSLFDRLKEVGLQLANIPRSLMSSFDLSAPMRQGIFLIGKPKQFWGSFKKMFGAFKSENAYKGIQDAIITHPNYQLARDSRLALTEMDVLMTQREEAFMSNWAEKIPVLGMGVRASGRAYVGFLNKLRFDTFADLVNKADAIGLNPGENRDLSKAIADFVNNATGRGTLPGSLQKSAVTLNTIFFSPRLLMSRLNLLNPIYYIRQEPFVRKEALKSLFAFVGFGITILTLMKMAGAEVGSDPRSSDFGKIKIGNTRIDMWGGFQPFVRVAAQITTGKYISSTTGKEMTLGEGYRPLTRADIVQHFLEGKEAPVPSFITALMKGKDITGENISVSKEIGLRFIPMVMQDMYDLIQESPGLLPISILGIFGVGIQTYKEKTRF
jgi:hypothetical protein